MICPVCNKNTCDEVPYQMAMKLLNNSGLLWTTHADPGGRALYFGDCTMELTIRLTDICNWCDYERVNSQLPEIIKRLQ